MKNSYRTLLVAMLGIIPLSIPSSAGGHGCPTFHNAKITGYITPPELNAVSGVVASRRNPDVLWIINDISGQPYVYAVHQNGRLLGRYTLTGAESRNYEDIALGPGPIRGMDYLYIGDIGDNAENNKHAYVYRTLEPAVDPNQAAVDIILPAVDRIKLTNPNGSHDAETLMIDTNGDLYIVTKRMNPAQIFLSPFPQSTTGDNLMHYLGTLSENWKVPAGEPYFKGPTGGDISPSGGKILIRGYWAAYLWERNENESIGQALSRPGCPVPLSPNEPQGEGIGFDPQGQGYYTTSEGYSQPIYYFSQSHIADINSDGVVDLLDLAILSALWEKTRCFACHGADLTGDGTVNLDDLAVFVNDWMLH
jgi:hypothetical protein